MKIQSGRETPPEAQIETVWTCCLESSPAKRSHQGEPQGTTPQLMSPSLSPKIFYTKITQSFVRPTKKERQRRKKKQSGDRLPLLVLDGAGVLIDWIEQQLFLMDKGRYLPPTQIRKCCHLEIA